jgi:SAM-dependent methyltransferase
MSKPDSYVLGRTDAETRRLMVQHHLFGPLTRRFFQAAGIGAGMKVLDIGSGAGDVALMLADMVGPRGRVVGVEMNPVIVETARARADSSALSNVSFVVGNAMEADVAADFDAVVGRWILMHVDDPTALLRHLVTRLKTGGIVAFHENDFTYPPTAFPDTELSQQFRRWAIPPEGAPGPQMRMGTQLLKTYQNVGLPVPELMLEAVIGGGPEWPGYEYLAGTLRNLVPALERMGLVRPGEVDLDTLAGRIRDDVVSQQGVYMLPMMIGAWTRKPA